MHHLVKSLNSSQVCSIRFDLLCDVRHTRRHLGFLRRHLRPSPTMNPAAQVVDHGFHLVVSLSLCFLVLSAMKSDQIRGFRCPMQVFNRTHSQSLLRAFSFRLIDGGVKGSGCWFVSSGVCFFIEVFSSHTGHEFVRRVTTAEFTVCLG